MEEQKRYTLRKILLASVWIILGAGTVVLLVAAIRKKDNKLCKGVTINIYGVQKNLFIDKKDVTNIIGQISNDKLEGKPVNTFDLAGMESMLRKSVWVKDAELFFDNNEVLKINVTEREPVARIFTNTGASFYIDTSVAHLPLSDRFSARLPVFTNYPSADINRSKADSNLLTDIKNISEYILRDSFWMAQIDQVDITPERSFEMIPKIGNQVIVFGNAEDFEEKFNNLLLFYKQVESKTGWNKYSAINVQYKGQVVCIKRGAADIKADSAKARQLMQTLVANAQRQANDSTSNIQLLQQPDDNRIPMPPDADEDSISEDAGVYKQIMNLNPNKDVPDVLSAKPITNPGKQTVHNSPEIKVEKKNIKSLPPKIKSIERPFPVPAKKAPDVKKVITKPPILKPKPKTVTTPGNDY